MDKETRTPVVNVEFEISTVRDRVRRIMEELKP